MSLTIVSEARDGEVTITLRLPFKDAERLLDAVTDSVLHGRLRGVSQEWTLQLMRDLDDHLQRNEGSTTSVLVAVNTEKDRSPVKRCPYCGFYGIDGKICRNCGEGA